MRLVALLAAMGLTTAPCLAQSRGHEREVAEFFVAYCVRALENPDMARGAARLFSWQPLNADQLKAGAPADQSAKLEGWYVISKTGTKLLLSFASTQTTTGCSVSSLDFQPDELTNELKSLADLQQVSDERAIGQRERTWQSELNGESLLIKLISSLRDNEQGGSIGAVLMRGN